VLHRVVNKLAHPFAGIFGAETVDRYVFESYTALARTSKVRNFLVPRTERFGTDRLTALATAKGAIEHPVPEVLFVCVQNSGRLVEGRWRGRSPESRQPRKLPATLRVLVVGPGIDDQEAFRDVGRRRRLPAEVTPLHVAPPGALSSEVSPSGVVLSAAW
jgi:arsenate reductase